MTDGIFAVHKPKGITSHDVVDIVRKKTGVKRVGHGGTLDPLAEGVLVIAVGRENTKKLDEYVRGGKEYIAEIMLGENSETDDSEGEKTEINKEIKPNLVDIQIKIKQFVGKISQTPPLYSALKLQGQPAHRRVRKGQVIKLEARVVEIKEIDLLSYEYPIIKLTVACGPGVYIRSIARDLGEKLGTGGYLKSLIRTRVGEFTLEKCLKISDLS
jgi:tRNA pseudouridine55 synthase